MVFKDTKESNQSISLNCYNKAYNYQNISLDVIKEAHRDIYTNQNEVDTQNIIVNNVKSIIYIR